MTCRLHPSKSILIESLVSYELMHQKRCIISDLQFQLNWRPGTKRMWKARYPDSRPWVNKINLYKGVQSWPYVTTSPEFCMIEYCSYLELCSFSGHSNVDRGSITHETQPLTLLDLFNRISKNSLTIIVKYRAESLLILEIHFSQEYNFLFIQWLSIIFNIPDI